jgi:aldehyde dehydrogenase (NAD+)
MSTQVYKNLIGGAWLPSSTNKTFLNTNPADTDDLIGEFQESGPADIDAAVDAATQAYKTWRLTPAPKRAEILYRTG